MAAQEKTKGINSGCSHGNSIDVPQHAEDNREFSQVSNLNLKSTYVLYNSQNMCQFLPTSNFKTKENYDCGDGDSIAYQEAGLFHDERVENDPFDE